MSQLAPVSNIFQLARCVDDPYYETYQGHKCFSDNLSNCYL